MSQQRLQETVVTSDVWGLFPPDTQGVWDSGAHGSHLMAGHPAYEGSRGRPRQAHYLLQLVYVYSFCVKGHHDMEVGVVVVVGLTHTSEDGDVKGEKSVSY